MRSLRPSPAMLLAMLLALVLSASAHALTFAEIDSQITAIRNRSALSGMTWSILVESRDGSITFHSLNPDTPRIPASNTKIFTSAAAYDQLGYNHYWAWSGTTIYNAIRPINKDSNNTYADELLRYLSSAQGGSHTSAAGASRVISWVASKGINTTGMAMYDGSGLNYGNRFTSRQVVSVVRYMMDSYTGWHPSLSQACVDGTLAGRFCGTNGSTRVWGKTGTLSPAIALSGYINNNFDGRTYLFSILVNNVDGRWTDARQACDDIAVIFAGPGLPQTAPVTPQYIVDNGTSGHSETGSWGTSTSAGYYGSNSRYALVYNQPQNNKSTWTVNLPQSGTYKVYGWWVAGSNRSPGAAYLVNHLGGQSLSRQDQQTGGGQWNLLGEYSFAAGNQTVVLESATSWNGGNSGAVISADAIGFTRTGSLVVDVVVDNTDPGFSASSNWFPSTSVAGYLGSNYHARATGSVSDAAVWTADLPEDGTYKVYARWTTGTNRATAAPYIVTTANGDVTVNVNQQQNNGQWVELGTWYLYQGLAPRVKLSCWTSSGSYVIADAVRFVKQ